MKGPTESALLLTVEPAQKARSFEPEHAGSVTPRQRSSVTDSPCIRIDVAIGVYNRSLEQ